MNNKHQEIIRKLEKVLKDSVDVVGVEDEYGDGIDVIGEVDLWSYCSDVGLLCIYEVKSNYSKKSMFKAVGQLRRARDYFVPIMRRNYWVWDVGLFYVFGDNLRIRYIG